MACSLAEALTLLEAAEGAVVVNTADAARIWAHHVPGFPDPPGDDFDEAEADRRARLAGSLAANASLRGPATADVLGPVALRAADAVATAPEGLSVSIDFVRHDAEEDPDSSLVRRETFTEGQLLVAHARKLALPDDASATASAYPPQATGNRDNSINDQAVQLARRLFDVCPEVDRVDVDILQANLQPMRFTSSYGVHEEGVKRLRRGVLPREPETRLNVAFQAAVARRVAAGSWSERLRQQATVASELANLMREAFVYLRAYRNRQQLRSYLERAKQVATATASLPRRPIEPSRKQSGTQALAGGGLDDRDRASDRAQAVLSRLAGAVAQLANGLADGDTGAVNGAGWQIGDALKDLRRARRDGAPAYAGIGDTLPTRLDELAALLSEVLVAREASETARSLLNRGHVSDDLEQLAREVVTRVGREQEDIDRRIVNDWLSEQALSVTDFVMPDREPPPGRLGSSQILAVVPLEQWSEAVTAMQAWPTQERETLAGAAVAIPLDGDHLLPIGLRLFGSSGSALPIMDPTVLADAAAVVSVSLVDATPLSAVVERTVEALLTASRERVRDEQRNHAWKQPHRQSTDPQEIITQLRMEYADQIAAYQAGQDDVVGVTVSLLLELCVAVASEDGQEDSLGAAVASIDVARIADTTNTYVELLGALMTLGMYATSSRS